jgi:Asp-tRNA(Asn)/Glu-tRNA(Gln) amidotransferase A subunit family amidase
MPDADREYPRLFPRPDQTIAGIGRAIREGRLTSVDVLNRCLEQLDRWESKVHAWVVLDREGAFADARTMDWELKVGRDRGPLHGIPIGIKDLFDVKGLPTACGSKRWVNRIAEEYAPVVRNLRTAGAVIMGKTVTTPYACLDPPATRNPWDLGRTPGGSSSGSAAAVACGMCFGALGTQTGGSITRPASFCGVAGHKPHKDDSVSIGVGFLPFAPSLDHVGPIARTVEDLRLMFEGMGGENWNHLLGYPTHPLEGPPRLGRLRGFFDRRATPDVHSVLDEAVRALSVRGADIVDRDDPVDFEKVLVDHRTVLTAEAARVHSEWLDEFPDDYPPLIREIIEEGRSVSAVKYLRAKESKQATENAMRKVFTQEKRYWITPATPSTAPDRSSTGDPSFNAPWSFTGLATVSFPIGLAQDGLPVAIQFITNLRDRELLQAAEWCERAIRTWRQ